MINQTNIGSEISLGQSVPPGFVPPQPVETPPIDSPPEFDPPIVEEPLENPNQNPEHK